MATSEDDKDAAAHEEGKRMSDWRHLNAAVEEFLDPGSTQRGCLQCGGELAIEVNGSSCRVWCRAEDVPVYTARGI